MNEKEANQINRVMNKKIIDIKKPISGPNGLPMESKQGPARVERQAKFFELDELENDGHYIDILSGRAVIHTEAGQFKIYNPATGRHEYSEAIKFQLYRMV